MLLYTLSAICVAALGLSATGESKLPVTTCKRNSVNYSACLKRAIEEAWPRFLAGLPEFDFPSLDPLIYEDGRVVFNSDEIRGEANFSNVTATGLSKARFSDVRTHFLDDVFRLEIDVQIPRLYGEGYVELDGTINLFRVTGKGNYNLTADDVSGTWDMIGHVVNDTWIIEHFNITPSFGNFKIHFNNLVEQNKEISNVVVNFVNEYWPALYRVMLPVTANVWDPWLTKFPNKIFSKVQFSKIFPLN